MNVGYFMGNLGKDCEVRAAGNGDPAANFSLGVQVGTKSAPETMWVRCSLYGKRAESLSQYLLKGQRVIVTGRLKMATWSDKEGRERTDLRMNVTDLWFAGPRQGSDDLGHEVAGHRAQGLKMERVRGPAPQDLNDDIPF